MKIFTTSLFFTFLFFFAVPAFTQHNNIFNDIENPEVVSRNKLPARSFAIPYSSVNQAIDNIWDSSPYFMSLNGKWKFKYSTGSINDLMDFILRNMTSVIGTKFLFPLTGKFKDTVFRFM